ncbi:UNVERIFIED_CONTAM: hypothetical protein Sindi_0479100 [Sesamum indicum]
MLVKYEATTHKSTLTVLVGEISTSKVKGKRARHWKRKKGMGKTIVAVARALSAPTAPVRIGKGKGKVLERIRNLCKDEMILRLGYGKAIVAEAMGSLQLVTSDHIRIE